MSIVSNRVNKKGLSEHYIIVAVYKYKSYIVIASAIADTAESFIRNIKLALDNNERIENAFGKLYDPKKCICNSEKIELTNGALIGSYSASSSFRGKNNGAKRIELAICDDFQKADELVSDEQKERKWKRFNDDLVKAIGITVLAIGALVAAGVALYMNWDKVSSFLKATWEGLKTSVTSVFSGMSKSISDTYNNIKDAITNTWKSIVSGTMAILQPFIDAIIGFFNKLTAPITQIFEGLKQYFSAFFDIIKTIFLGSLLLILDLVTGNFDKLSEDAQGIFNNLKASFTEIWSAIGKVFSGALSVISIALETGWNLIKSVALGAWEGIKTGISAIWDAIVWIFKNLTLVGIITTHWNDIKTTTTNVFNGLKTFFIEIWGSIVTYLQNLPESFKNSGISIFNSLWDGIKSVWTNITSWIENSMTWLREKLTFWKTSQKEMSGGNGGSGTVTVPSYAVGTPFVPTDGLALIHRGEAIIPAQYNPYNNANSSNNPQTKTGDTIHYNIQKVEVVDPTDVNSFMLDMTRKSRTKAQLTKNFN